MVNPGELGGRSGTIGRVDDPLEHVGDHVSRRLIHRRFTALVVVDGVAILSGNGSDVVRLVVSSPVGKGGVRSGDLQWGDVEADPVSQGVGRLL